MSHDTEFPTESMPTVLSDDRQQAIDELGRLAGASLRSPAPDNGASTIRLRARNQRLIRTGAAVVSILAVVVFGIAVAARRDDSLQPGEDTPDNTVVVPELHDVDRQEAETLARRALLTVDAGGDTFVDDQDWIENGFPARFDLTIAAIPECAVLRSFGVFQPTTKSAGAFQHGNLIIQNVQVFATAEDASRAMDMIAGDVYPPCWFDFWDREAAFENAGVTATTVAWDPPKMTSHGDRQITVGQHTTYVNGAGHGFPPDQFTILTFIQIGRAITFVNPVYDGTLSDPLFEVENTTAAAAAALTNVFDA